MGELKMFSNIKSNFVFFSAFMLILAGCSMEDSGTPSASNATQGADINAIYQAALADSRRPAEEVARDAGRKPDTVLKFFGIKPGQRVADISSGDGYYTRILSGVVGSEGSVVAENSGRRSSDENQAKYTEQYSSYENVELNFEAPEDMSLPDNSLDAAMLSLTIHHWHHSDETGEFVPQIALDRYQNILRMLKPGGVLGIIEHASDAGMSRVVSDFIHRIPSDIAKADLTLAGFVLDSESYVHANYPDDDTTIRWTQDPRDATNRIVHLYRKP
ncbi:MAG: putative methyltransferase [Gammaproteobacteria bacterium]|jgi:predicted methyltransferase